MTDSAEFASRIRARYPEGLTGLLALGGTRTAYILNTNHNQAAADPGHIGAMNDYAEYGLEQLKTLINAFFDLGGQNLVVSVLSYQQLHDGRGTDYAQVAAALCRKLMQEEWTAFYRQTNTDPYFVGIDTLLHLPEHQFAHQLGAECSAFHNNWEYTVGHRKLIWEIAPIPLFSFWKAHEDMGEAARAEMEAALHHTDNLQTMHDILYRYYSRAAYGTDLPIPHFYLGSNRNGDMKLRSVLPIALLCGDALRLYYTPYPSLFTTRETLRAILEDLAFGKPLRSNKMDYSGQVTAELLETEYERVQLLRNDPLSTLGLIRSVNSSDSD